jgi:hypothetical protein
MINIVIQRYKAKRHSRAMSNVILSIQPQNQEGCYAYNSATDTQHRVGEILTDKQVDEISAAMNHHVTVTI